MTKAFLLQKVLLPLSLGAAEPASLTRGATAWLRLIDLYVDGNATSFAEIFDLVQLRKHYAVPKLSGRNCVAPHFFPIICKKA